ncbi:unnamed protein product, partial [Musa acuminata subsp. burmannicoides]
IASNRNKKKGALQGGRYCWNEPTGRATPVAGSSLERRWIYGPTRGISQSPAVVLFLVVSRQYQQQILSQHPTESKGRQNEASPRSILMHLIPFPTMRERERERERRRRRRRRRRVRCYGDCCRY